MGRPLEGGGNAAAADPALLAPAAADTAGVLPLPLTHGAVGPKRCCRRGAILLTRGEKEAGDDGTHRPSDGERERGYIKKPLL